ncbi:MULTISPECIES: MFS transporter [unclassified Mycolicibacterium]|uniref:MFS transporter n=1 Tax=unclassified Mycolicibacterium TaxID=2636767 RepID=UPI0012DBFB2A|nr:MULTISPECIES: MFS transporter [unclassified Mycolicibacterium]MUL83454.1 MFS transporter [Mycolicibacterium sp. CBMA 329]MUL90445.1 MFS transporter [Mycolicibacterium sp. CBMA 331]MUM00417.1 MFS transporter [Mycolicibacterium sp. CBMA 334]MUM41389.1 MFS transporter [Mycolicibacterium sp. CBMA 247]MUM45853.1 MFS transporter [Mycolicibacterium sp. CBMA 294]
MTNPGRARVLAWALWDCGATGLNAIVVTFVFSVYLTGSVGSGLPADTSPASWLGRAMAVAGLVVACLAPATGVWVDAPQRRRRVLAVMTGAAVVLTSAMSLIRDDHRYLLPGLILLACTAACNELATVPYNAMLRQLSTPETSGRISGLGLALGYAGSVLLLLLAYVGFIAGDGDTRGLLGIPIQDGQNVRAVMLLTAVWFLLFALPVFIIVPPVSDAGPVDRVGLFGAYRRLWAEIRSEWQRDHNVVYYLLASAVFRDGLAGVFAFGAVLGVSVYGISEGDVLLFGISACTVAALGSVAGGLLDDRVGSKPVIVGSLVCLIVVGLSLLTLSGPVAFWVCGLLLCLFIGPTLSSARTLMLRISADGKEGVAFGLYTTTGRAVSFIAPWLFFTFIDMFGSDRAGMGGLCVVLALGLAGMLAVRVPSRLSSRPATTP